MGENNILEVLNTSEESHEIGRSHKEHLNIK